MSKVDLTLVVNINPALGNQGRQQVVQSLRDFLRFVQIAEDRVRVAVVAYDGTTAVLSSYLRGSYLTGDPTAVNEALNSLESRNDARPGGDIALALRTVIDQVYSSSNDKRPDVGNLVILTYGRLQPGDPTPSVADVAVEAERARQRKIGVLVTTYYPTNNYVGQLRQALELASWRGNSVFYGVSPSNFLSFSLRNIVIYGQGIVSNFGENLPLMLEKRDQWAYPGGLLGDWKSHLKIRIYQLDFCQKCWRNLPKFTRNPVNS